MSDPARVPTTISLAGSDSGGGAGIQADLKAFARCEVHGMTAITAITAQSTVGVESIHHVPPRMIVDQVRVVAEDIGIDAAKTGMLGDAATIDAVVEALEFAAGAPVVVDPVLVAESGSVLLEHDALAALVDRLLPRAAVATPNLLEARRLTGLDEGASQAELARAVQALGPDAVVVTGGHTGEGTDVLFDPRSGKGPIRIEGAHHPSAATHGSGCTHSAALAALLARGEELEHAAFEAKRITAEAVRSGLRGIGEGAGPVNVFGIAGHAASRGETVPRPR